MSTITLNGKTIELPEAPKFIFAPDEKTMELYIVHTSPYALIWIRQSTPTQLFIIEGEQDATILREAGEFYKQKANKSMGGN